MPDFGSNMNIICLESEAFKALLKEVATQIKKDELFQLDPWVSEKEAMQLLKIASKTTFQKYRDAGDIDFRMISTKHIVYRRTSILNFIENSSKSRK